MIPTETLTTRDSENSYWSSTKRGERLPAGSLSLPNFNLEQLPPLQFLGYQ